MLNTKVNFLDIDFKNPIITASGTYNTQAYKEFMDLNKLGGVTLKGVAKEPWLGNNTPRIAEVYGGMLNAVGLQNPGIDYLIQDELEILKAYDTKVIVNIAGKTIEDYCEVVERLQTERVDLLELNISCPNVKEGGVAFGTDPKSAFEITKEVKKYCKQPLVVKLSPNVSNIKEIASAVEDAGADALSLINTLIGMKIDIHRKKPVLANKIGGFSGPAIKPVAIRMVYQVYDEVSIPIIGMGGVMTGEDAIEFMMAGASLVAVGTANLLNPSASVNIIEQIQAFMQKEGVKDIKELIGAAH
ncbi:dihydroorotate dehydrogenase [Vallitalea okinawensis]|uniref:dihydroorotate dehydrogenase n=1 Tax=Vallitalea okinawensis TaxID=2078660 RepID=UPI000CFD22BB|nr:dihydroorotate dehydrogenase [Vallitalea okinawensis]